jgi:hypothetical protein
MTPSARIPRHPDLRCAVWICIASYLVACDSLSHRAGEPAAVDADAPFAGHVPLTGGGALVQTDTLNSYLLPDAPTIARPTSIRVAHGRIWVRDSEASPWIHLLDEATGHIHQSLLRRGEARGDLAALSSFDAVPSRPNASWFFDPVLQRLTILTVGSPQTVDTTMVNLQADEPVGRVVWTSPDRIIGIAASGSARFTLFTNDGVRLSTISGPLLGDSAVPEIERMRASSSFIAVCAWPGIDGFAIAYGAAGRVETYASNGRLGRILPVPFPTEPAFSYDSAAEDLVHRDSWTHYVSCAGSSSHLYALYSGKAHPAEGPSRESDSGHMVHVFALDGSLERLLHLDAPARGIAVSDSQVLYTVSSLDRRIRRYILARKD